MKIQTFFHCFLQVAFLLAISNAYSQSKVESNYKKSLLEHYFSQQMQATDTALYDTNKQLISQPLTKENFAVKYKLLFTLWNMNQLNDMEIICKQLMNQSTTFYADIDSANAKIYGNGTKYSDFLINSFHNTLYYANEYLGMKNIKTGQFEKALVYLTAGDKYSYSALCGGMVANVSGKHTLLKTLCRVKTGKGQQIIDSLLPNFYKHSNPNLILAIQEINSTEAINKLLMDAEKSLTIDECQTKNFYGTLYESNPVAKGYEANPVTFIDYVVRVKLFDKTFEMQMRKRADDVTPAQDYVFSMFRKSFFYNSLMN